MDSGESIGHWDQVATHGTNDMMHSQKLVKQWRPIKLDTCHHSKGLVVEFLVVVVPESCLGSLRNCCQPFPLLMLTAWDHMKLTMCPSTHASHGATIARLGGLISGCF